MNQYPIIEATKPHVHRGIAWPGVYEIVKECSDCFKEYVALVYNSKLFTTGRCMSCSEIYCEKEKEAEIKQLEQKRLQNFFGICPLKYQYFKKELLPNQISFDRIIGWVPNERGLLMTGDSQKGKTRSAWRLLKRLYVIESVSFKAITELQFSHEVAKFGKSETLQGWLNALCHTKVLFIDDLGKCVMTERVVAELFYILEERMSNNRPIIATMQLSAQEFVDKISKKAGQDMAEAIINRLKSNCEIVNF